MMPGSAADATESHRVYWQQWLSNNETSTGSRREWITSSVAIRMAPQAKAIDVTTLLRSSLGLEGQQQARQTNEDENDDSNDDNRNNNKDALILVGTLYSLSSDFVQYEHHGVTSTARVISRGGGMHHRSRASSPPSTLSRTTTFPSNSSTMIGSNSIISSNNNNNNNKKESSTTHNTSSRSEPFHLVYTLRPGDAPLEIRRRMVRRIKTWEARAVQRNGGRGRHIMAPQIQWYFIPQIESNSNATTANTNNTATTTTSNNNNIPNCLQLEGYCTSMEEEEDTEEISNHDEKEEEENDNDNDDENDCSLMEYDSEEGPGQHRNDATKDKAADDDDKANRTLNTTAFATEQEKMEDRFPWLKQPDDPFFVSTKKSPTITPTATDATIITTTRLASLSKDGHRRQRRWQRQLARERQRGNDLIAACRSQTPPSHLSGFLLKRCTRDRHVWRKVHCVLTNDYLWFMTRVYELNLGTDTSNAIDPQQQQQQQQDNADYRATPLQHRYSKHGRLRLTRALLLEPAIDYAPLYRTPYAFELVVSDGTCHAFRATSKRAQRQWIRVLSERIVQSYENSLLEQAQWMLVEQCQAQSLRMENVLNVAGWLPDAEDNGTKRKKTWPRRRKSGSAEQFQIQPNCLIHWGLRVADYRELARHVHSILPAKNPVIASAAVPNPTSNAQATLAALSLSPAPQTPAVRQWVRTCWQDAIDLWNRLAAGPSKECQVIVNHDNIKGASNKGHDDTETPFAYPRRVETLLRHVEFQIVGHPSKSHTNNNSRSAVQLQAALALHQGLPPSIDLFDDLFQELQTMVAVEEFPAALEWK